MPPPLGFGYWLPISGEGGMGIIGPPVSFLIRLRGGRVPGAPRNLTICITIFFMNLTELQADRLSEKKTSKLNNKAQTRQYTSVNTLSEESWTPFPSGPKTGKWKFLLCL